jgi:hypothetical protein
MTYLQAPYPGKVKALVNLQAARAACRATRSCR